MSFSEMPRLLQYESKTSMYAVILLSFRCSPYKPFERVPLCLVQVCNLPTPRIHWVASVYYKRNSNVRNVRISEMETLCHLQPSSLLSPLEQKSSGVRWFINGLSTSGQEPNAALNHLQSLHRTSSVHLPIGNLPSFISIIHSAILHPPVPCFHCHLPCRIAFGCRSASIALASIIQQATVYDCSPPTKRTRLNTLIWLCCYHFLFTHPRSPFALPLNRSHLLLCTHNIRGLYRGLSTYNPCTAQVHSLFQRESRPRSCYLLVHTDLTA